MTHSRHTSALTAAVIAAATSALCALAALPAQAQGADGAIAGTRLLAPRINRHALIIGISRYADPNTPPLPGAHIDRESATQMAQAMQVPQSNITYLQDEQATGNNIRKALAELSARVLDGDRVFIHYSGHGTRYNDPVAGGCIEALLAHDGGQSGTLTNREMADLLRPITGKTDKLFVMYDACHSGGLLRGVPEVRTRSTAESNGEGLLRPKFAAISQECGLPVNIKTRNLMVEAVAKGGLPQDIIHLSASRDNEVSFDDEKKGGLATQFMRDCMLRDAQDLDGSGAITMDEIRICAQDKVNKRMQNDRNFKAHNLTLSGNAGFVPAWFSQAVGMTATQFGRPAPAAAPVPAPVQPAPVQPAPVVAVAVAAPAPAPIVVAQPAPPPPPLTGAQALQQMFAQRDAKRNVQVTLGKPKLKIGQDVLDISVQSDRGGYVYLAQAGSDNKSVYLLFPNDLDQANRIEPGQRMAL
ncbi:MAG: caspase family protein, partial [Bdellovibrionales bacterium]|nr:caspase family protein [Ramlibacter sp.]